jgi:retinol dehydrogenase-13
MKTSHQFFYYYKQYKWSNIAAMIKNNRRGPKICHEDFNNKLVVITGATSGIGYVTARKYASHGANLLCINRNLEKSEKLCREIRAEFGVKCDFLIADLSILENVYQVSEELVKLKTPIDVLVHNAGIYLTKKEVTIDGFEKVLMVHYLSSFLINYRLMDKLIAQQKARIILVSSEGHRFVPWGLRVDDLMWEARKYSGLTSYGSAKTAVTINSMHPGAVKTDSGQENGRFYRWYKKNIIDKTLKSPNLSAEALYYLGVSSEIEGISGKYFNLTTLEEPAPPALDRDVAQKLWDKSLALLGLTEEKYDERKQI